ncbi:uncharacterized protein LOC130798029 [Amaranthus tricolor]|uniref:uncharacterized protein LOC130798029 n=1 Tax=Amaranthus tricolor TaxID=29722 RepID=UPI002591091C|nr:uncharacterized protein LOC130798029 [Amaranthus tricolor]
MSQVQSYYSLSFQLSSLVSRNPRNHYLPLSSSCFFSHTSSLSPPNFVTLSRRTNVVIQASSENSPPTNTISVDEDNTLQSETQLISASEIVRNFYAGINCHDISAVEPLIADNCVYEDLIFPRPFVGRKSILEFFGKFIDYVSTDLQFVIDAISEEDSSAIGVTWHLEWKGKPFPFSKGCSFYQVGVFNGMRQIVYARDSVEPAIKPGESALVAIRGVVWLLQRFPNLIERL